VRLIVYTDSVYRRLGDRVYGEVAFTLFLAALSDQVEKVTIVGRLDRSDGPAHYPLPEGVEFVALPHYRSHTAPREVLASLIGSMRAFWRALASADAAWLFGPYLHTQLFVLLALLRKRTVVLGVRQNFPAYVRSRRPTHRWMHIAADLLEGSWKVWSTTLPTIVVGPDLGRRYRRSRSLLTIAVSLITQSDLSAGRRSRSRDYTGELTLLCVGRLDAEKNPLLLADVLARLQAEDQPWRMVICGEGPLRKALHDRLVELNVSGQADLRGHVGLHSGLLELYRTSHALLHVSWTEGFPQVLVEAFASGIPVVATAVGGVPSAVGDAAVLIPPGQAEAAAEKVRQLAGDPALRERLVSAGFALAENHTVEAETRLVANFIAGASARRLTVSPAPAS
jgi:glycosyltransferase involved in cell wall biosynthesis